MRLARVAVLTVSLAAALAAALTAPFALAAWQTWLDRPRAPGPLVHYPMAFRHLGTGNLTVCASHGYPMIEQSRKNQVTTFLVKASVPCGLEVRRPSGYVQDGVVYLSYETHFTGSADMCNCEYRSIYTMVGLPPQLTRVEFAERFVDSAP